MQKYKIFKFKEFPNLLKLLVRFEDVTTEDFTKHVGICNCSDCVLRRNSYEDMLTLLNNDYYEEQIEELENKVDSLKEKNRKLILEKMQLEKKIEEKNKGELYG